MPQADRPALRADARRNTEKLREAAAAAFSEHGLDAPLDKIAKQAGVSVGTLYNRFGNRDALLDAVVADLAELQVRRAMEAARAQTGPWVRLTAFIRTTCQSQAADPAFNDAFSRSYPNAPALKAVCDRSLAFAADLVSAAQDEGTLRPEVTPADIARVFQVNGDLIRAGDDVGRRRVLALLLDGMRPTPGGAPLPQ